MNFIVINESFQCSNCKSEVPKLKGSCRNHCPFCLHSLHVDADFPGDRASECHALMSPIGLTQSSKKGWILLHECKKCGHTMKNKMAEDDNMELAAKISTRGIEED
jgi:hypothetical protein